MKSQSFVSALCLNILLRFLFLASCQFLSSDVVFILTSSVLMMDENELLLLVDKFAMLSHPRKLLSSSAVINGKILLFD